MNNGASLVVQWLGIRLPMQGTRLSPRWEDPHAVEQLGRDALGPVLRSNESSEKPSRRNAEYPCSLQLEKATCSGQDPVQPLQINLFKIK